jgi:hypothetical protein
VRVRVRVRGAGGEVKARMQSAADHQSCLLELLGEPTATAAVAASTCSGGVCCVVQQSRYRAVWCCMISCRGCCAGCDVLCVSLQRVFETLQLLSAQHDQPSAKHRFHNQGEGICTPSKLLACFWHAVLCYAVLCCVCHLKQFVGRLLMSSARKGWSTLTHSLRSGSPGSSVHTQEAVHTQEGVGHVGKHLRQSVD